MEDLKIIRIPIDQLTPYANNTRKHTQKDIDQIKASIKADGFNDPVGVWGKKNVIVEGHGRVEACRQRGITDVPCILLAEEIADLEAQGMDLSGLDFRLDRGEETPMILDGSGAIEYGEEAFGDDTFNCECPVCGFRFNEK